MIAGGTCIQRMLHLCAIFSCAHVMHAPPLTTRVMCTNGCSQPNLYDEDEDEDEDEAYDERLGT